MSAEQISYADVNTLKPFSRENWTGKNVFYCKGYLSELAQYRRLVAGPKEGFWSAIATHIMVWSTVISFLLFVCPYYCQRLTSVVPVVFILISVLDYILLLMTEFSDPGILLSTKRGKVLTATRGRPIRPGAA